MSVTSGAVAGRLPARRIVLADLLPGAVVRDVVLVLAAAGLVGLSAQLSVHIPGTPVPITGQTFAVLLAGAALGWQRGLAAMAVYLVAGLVGVPWFAGGTGGTKIVSAASFGYIVGFFASAVLVGALARRGLDRTPVRTVLTMLLGTLVIYAFGVPWLMAKVHVDLATAFRLGVRPFLVGDLLKVLLAAALLPGAWWLLGRRRGGTSAG